MFTSELGSHVIVQRSTNHVRVSLALCRNRQADTISRSIRRVVNSRRSLHILLSAPNCADTVAYIASNIAPGLSFHLVVGGAEE